MKLRVLLLVAGLVVLEGTLMGTLPVQALDSAQVRFDRDVAPLFTKY